MARLVECDGCGKRTYEMEKSPRDQILRMEFKAVSSRPDAIADTAGWSADLCMGCMGIIKDPRTWPRTEPESPR